MKKDVKSLFDEGFAIHWLKPKSKIPVKSGWTSGNRDDYETLKKEFKKGYNVGVRLGSASVIEDALGDKSFLAVIDVDVKSDKPEHLQECMNRLKEIAPKNSLSVLSGRGNGSKHIYVRTREPQTPFRYAQSKHKVLVSMPSVKPSKYELKNLPPETLKAGLRLRPAWEISIMGEGQQVVLPPSIHPDSKKRYQWENEKAPIAFKNFKGVTAEKKETESSDVSFKEFKKKFRLCDFNAEESKLNPDDKALLINGVKSEDRSAEAFGIAQKLLSLGYSKNEILSCLTNTDYFLGSVGYDHTQSSDRVRAAYWVFKYTLKKADTSVKERTEEKITGVLENFEDVSHNPPNLKLSAEETEKEAKELEKNLSWQDRISRAGQGKPTDPPKNTMRNILLILNGVMDTGLTGPFIGRNQFTIEDKWLQDTPWGCKEGRTVTDSDSLRIKDWLSKKFRMEPAKEKIEECLILMAERNGFHPVKEYLETLRWDGIERIDTWLSDYLGAEGPKEYIKTIGSKTLVAMVARIYRPGIKFDQVLILEGKQNIGKSYTARILAGDDWFSDSSLNIADKDAVVNMQGVWVYELGEMAVMNRFHVNQMKEFISRSTDRIRPPYGKRMISYPRQTIFIGTTNNDEYLKDKTGNRRFWPVKVGVTKEVDLEWLREDRDQLLAEAVQRFLNGETLYIDNPDIRDITEKEQLQRVESDELESMISEYLNNLKIKNTEIEEKSGKWLLGSHGPFRISDLMENSTIFTGLKNDRQTQMRVAGCLKNLGFDKKTTSFGSVNGKFWIKNDE